MDSYEKGFSYLNKSQKKVLEECLIKKNGGLGLPMGYGKTLIGTLLGLKLSNKRKTLVVVSKSLVGNFISEFKKFFGECLIYQILHQEYIKGKKLDNFTLDESTMIVITTPEVVSKIYKKNNIEDKIIRRETETHYQYLQHENVVYVNPSQPLFKNCKGADALFSENWGCLIIDEIQNFTNIKADKARGLISIYANHRWGMSGTIFDEPKIEKLLGYYTILNIPNTPRDLQKFKHYVAYGSFKGTKETLVYRDSLDFVELPRVNKNIVSHELLYEEILIYINMKDMIQIISEKASNAIGQAKRKFSAFILAMITYLRQSIISPLIPIASLLLDMYELNNNSVLSKKLFDSLFTPEVKKYLKKEDSIISSRVKKVLETTELHKNEKIIIFTSFRTSLDLFKNLIKEKLKRPVVTLNSSDSSEKRRKTVDDFNSNDDNTIFLLTYDIGCEGLNLQTSSTVFLVDLSWNSCKSEQAIARVLRQGQKSDVVNIYYFTSNLQIEQAMFKKHEEKTKVITELETGNSKMDISAIKTRDIIDTLNLEDNIKLLKKITN